MSKDVFTAEMAREKIQKAKFEINLADYAQAQGYELNKQKSTATDVILQKHQQGEVVDTIGVRYYPQTGYKYWTAMDSSDKGSLLDFEKNKNRLDLNSTEGKRSLYEKIDEFLGNAPAQKISLKPAEPKTAMLVEKRLTDRELHLLPLEDTRYLEGRGISEKTYRSPEFQCQVYNEKVELRSKTYTNTVFPIRNEDVLLAKIRRNDEELGYRGGQFNKIQEKRENGIHTSNFPNAPLDKLYLAESPIDALSYFELHHKEIRAKNQQVAFISTVGNPSHSAYNTMQKFINEANPKEIVSILDNDRAGRAFTINLLGKLSKPEQDLSNHIKAEMNVSQKTEATLSIHFSYDTDAKRQAMAKSLKENLLEPLQKAIPEGSEATIKVTTLTKSAHHAHLEIKFGYDNHNLQLVEKGLIQAKGLEQGFSLEHPKQKDWNDELKRQKPFVVTLERNGVELPEKRFSQGVEAVSYVQQQDEKVNRKIYLEKYNLSHEVDKPQMMAHFEQGTVKEMNTLLRQEVEKQQAQFLHQKSLEADKLLALQLAQNLFPQQECVISKTTYNAETKQHFIELQSIENQSQKHLEASPEMGVSFAQKINAIQTDQLVLVFNKDKQTTLLNVPELKESTLLEKEFIAKNEGYVAEKTEHEKTEMLKKNLEAQCGELKLSDRQGDIIATSDYDIKMEGGKPIIHKIENFEYGKINQEGLDMAAIKTHLDDATEQQMQSNEQLQAKPDIYHHPEQGLEM